jgi:large subunit ribosomal protein L19
LTQRVRFSDLSKGIRFMKAQHLTRETIRELGATKRDFPRFDIGDHIAISQWITEGSKKRLQVFEGDVIAMHHKGASSTFTVRKISANNVYVERIYPFYTPIIDSIKIVRKGDVRRAKLYYLRDRVGKKAQVKEKVMTKEARALMREKAKAEEAARKAKHAEQIKQKEDAKLAKTVAKKAVETAQPAKESTETAKVADASTPTDTKDTDKKA